MSKNSSKRSPWPATSFSLGSGRRQPSRGTGNINLLDKYTMKTVDCLPWSNCKQAAPARQPAGAAVTLAI